MLNLVNLMGRFAQHPELKVAQSGKNLTRFTLAVGRVTSYGSNEKMVDWIDCVAWEKTAQFICRHFKKGDAIIVCGRLETRQYQDKQGNNRKIFEVVVREVNFAAYVKKEEENTQKIPDDTELLADADLPF